MKRWTWFLPLVLLLAGVAWANDEPTGPWHPEITAYPRLAFDADDRAAILDRLDREPYLTLMQRARNRANGGFSPTPPDPYDAGREYSNSNVAKAAAFVAWIDDDPAMAEKSAQVLEAMATDFGQWTYQLIDYDIHIAEAEIGYCFAYDILAGTGLIEPTRLTAIGDMLGGMVAAWYQEYINQLAFCELGRFNNHLSKTGAAFAVAGMTLNQRDDANKWFNYGMAVAYDVVFNKQTTDEGVFAEGPYYYEYTAVNHLPMFIAYDRLIGEDATIQKRGFCLIGPNCPWEDFEIVNPLDHREAYESSLWFVKARLPNGASPPLDDAALAGSYNGLVSSFYGDGLLAWEWLNNAWHPLFSEHCSAIEPELIAQYDDAVAPTPPPADFGPLFILPEAGNAFFRSGWDAADTWAMFIAENGRARQLGSGHEHGDNLSVSLFARGEYLLLDPGYIAWSYHDVVRLGKHHNVPTVDGDGPPAPVIWLAYLAGGTDAFITDGLTEVGTPFVTGASEWNDASFERTVFFPEADYLIVMDDMTADAPRTFGVLWHGQGGGDTGFPFIENDDGATWEPGDAAVDVHVAASTGDTTNDTLLNIHSFQWMQQIEHNSLDVRAADPSAVARFLSIVTPYATTDEAPREVTWIRRDGLIAATIDGAEPVFVMAQEANEAQAFTALPAPLPSLTTRGRSLYLTGSADTGEAYFAGGGSFVLDGKRPWAFAEPGRVWIEWLGDEWNFSFAEGGNMLVTYAAYLPDIDADEGVRWDWRGGILRIWSVEAASFTVDFTWRGSRATTDDEPFLSSFPRRRESIAFHDLLDPRLRGGDRKGNLARGVGTTP